MGTGQGWGKGGLRQAAAGLDRHRVEGDKRIRFGDWPSITVFLTMCCSHAVLDALCSCTGRCKDETRSGLPAGFCHAFSTRQHLRRTKRYEREREREPTFHRGKTSRSFVSHGSAEETSRSMPPVMLDSSSAFVSVVRCPPLLIPRAGAGVQHAERERQVTTR